MTQKRSHRPRKENLKTQTSNTSRAQVQLGKLVRLPYIRKTSKQNKNNLQDHSLDNKETRIMRNSNKQLNLFQHTHANLLTQQEIQLCQDYSQEKETFPKISQLPRERSIESLEISVGARDRRSLTKVEFMDRVKDFKLGPIIGKGTYSIVRAAKSKEGKKVAIKTYLKTSLSNQDRRKNLQNEISVLSLLQHPHIISYQQYIQTQNGINIVSELLQNRSLADYIKGECFQTIPQEIVRFMVKQLLKAIAYCHSKDIVHRDLKPQNILINQEFKVKLIDFGFSLQLPKQNHVLYDYCGTPNYIAPEVIQREGYFGKPADIWAVGVILYRMVVGTYPFKNLKEKDLHSKNNKNELKLPSDMTPQLTNLLHLMLNFDFWKRPTADQILNADWFMH